MAPKRDQDAATGDPIKTERMYAWVYRIYVAIEILTFLALLACAAHYGMRIF